MTLLLADDQSLVVAGIRNWFMTSSLAVGEARSLAGELVTGLLRKCGTEAPGDYTLAEEHNGHCVGGVDQAALYMTIRTLNLRPGVFSSPPE